MAGGLLKKYVLFMAMMAVCRLGYSTLELKKCLEETWGIDSHSTAFILKKWEPILGDEAVIQDFIAISKTLGIEFSVSKELRRLHPEDGVLCAPDHHLVVFESPYVRVLWGSTRAGEREPFHVHAWKSLMVVIIPTDYKMEYPNGTADIWEGRIGVYELPANERYACTNIGARADAILRFEVKE